MMGAEILLNQGATIGEASRKIGVTEQTYYRCRKEYGGLRIEQAKRLKSLEKENAGLKKLVADLPLDNAIVCYFLARFPPVLPIILQLDNTNR